MALAAVLVAAGVALNGVPPGVVRSAEASPSSLPQGAAASAPAAGPADAQSRGEIDKSVVFLPCIPVAAYWTGSPPSDGPAPGPTLAIVSTRVRPKNATVYVDGRFAGRARYLDGKPGYLYLEPGVYTLEIRRPGYRTVAIELKAEAGCRYDLKHSMERVKGAAEEADDYGKGRPLERVFAPLRREGPPPSSVAGPSPREEPAAGREEPKPGASLRLTVKPASASVSIDGEFVATGRELEHMENPLAVTPGSHLVEVEAPGYTRVVRNVVLRDGETVEIAITLSAAAGNR